MSNNITLKILDRSILPSYQKYVLIEGNFEDPNDSSNFLPAYVSEIQSEQFISIKYYDQIMTNIESILLPNVTTTLSIPHVDSVRIWISIDKPLVFYLDQGKIIYSNAALQSDQNFYIIYDKVEISYKNDNIIYMNPTAVDYFSIPLSIDLIAKSGDSSLSSGVRVSRKEVLDTISYVLVNGVSVSTEENIYSINKPSAIWENLLLYYHSDNLTLSGYSDSFMRVISPSLAYVDNNQAKLPVDNPFIGNYFYQDLGDNFLKLLWAYYSEDGNYINIDTSEIINAPDYTHCGDGVRSSYYIFNGTVVNDDLFFKNIDSSCSVTLPQLSNDDSTTLFGGIWGNLIPAKNSPEAIIIRQITSAISVGLLPLVSSGQSDISKSQFDKEIITKDMYYSNNKYLNLSNNSGPWYDLYASAIHNISNSLIYGFAYDDALGQDGTLVMDQSILNFAEITIGNMSGLVVPDPSNDTKIYEEILLTIPSDSILVCGYGNNSISMNYPGGMVYNASMPLHMNYSINNGGSLFEFDIYLTHQFIYPAHAGIVFDVSGDVNQIIFGNC